MDRRHFAKALALGGAGAALGASSVAASAVARDQPQIKWRWASSFPRTLTISYDACIAFTKRIAEITGGGFQIQLFGPGELVPAFQVFDAVQNATVEMGYTASYFNVGKDPTFGFATAMPFGMNTRQHNAWMLRGGGLDLCNAFYKKYNVTYFPCSNTGAQMGGWYRKEIKTLGDLNGLKMRIGGLGGEILKRMGVVPQSIPAGDIYPALERGTIDAVEYVGPFDDEQLGLFKVAKYYYYPGWWEGSLQVGNFVNLDKWNTLPTAYQAAFRVACEEMNNHVLAGYDAFNGPALRRLVGAGAELRAFPRDVLSKAYSVAYDYYDEVAAKNENFRTIFINWQKFREDAILWNRIGEASYDNFVFGEHARSKR